MPFAFKANCTVLTFGVTMSGKSHFVLDCLKNRLIYPMPKTIYYVYKLHQPIFSTWNENPKNPFINFINNNGLDIKQLDFSQPSALVLDDILLELSSSLSEVAIYGSHHLKITVFFITQLLYCKNEIYRTIASNSRYMILFHSFRNSGQIECLARQNFPGKAGKALVEAYKEASNHLFSPVVVNFNTEFAKEGVQIIFDFWSEWPTIFTQS